ncbi:hypothetical protein HDV05_006887 [Chytridiales sp. JEL 0842]|nr:hypothetical protein HDV05_006887 [Chytridiales sp. JEL 0842]
MLAMNDADEPLLLDAEGRQHAENVARFVHSPSKKLRSGWASLFGGHSHEHGGHDHDHGSCNHEPVPTEEDINIPMEPVSQPLDLDLYQAAQRGASNRVSALLEAGEVTANSRDAENCTALHWAAINNHLGVARLLIDKGAEVDAIGGDLLATPLHWAARSGHVQMVTFLIKKGAQPSLKDNQGYNALHLAAHAGHAMMILYLLASGMDVDETDTMSRTALMWTAYQGSSLDSMEVLLQNQPFLDRTDSTGFTALHWAVISQHLQFAKLLIQAGASVDVKDSNGKTPADWAKERGYLKTYEQIIAEHTKKKKCSSQPFSQAATNRITYILPFIQLPLTIWAFCAVEWFLAIPLVLVDTSHLYLSHLSFMLLFTTCCYTFYVAICKDPGYLRKIKSQEERFKVVRELAEIGKLDVRNFTVVWDSTLKPSESCILGPELCGSFTIDPVTTYITIWALLNSFWVVFLCISQSYQIAEAITTNEVINYHRFSYMVHPEDVDLPSYRRRKWNSFNRGPKANCVEFWTDGASKSDLNWYTLYEVPPNYRRTMEV